MLSDELACACDGGRFAGSLLDQQLVCHERQMLRKDSQQPYRRFILFFRHGAGLEIGFPQVLQIGFPTPLGKLPGCTCEPALGGPVEHDFTGLQKAD